MVGLTLIACPAICWWNPVLSSYRLHCSTSLVSWWLHVWNAQCLQKKISKLSTQAQILYAIKINFTSIFDLYKEFLFYFYYSLGLEIATPIDYIFFFFFFGGGGGGGAFVGRYKELYQVNCICLWHITYNKDSLKNQMGRNLKITSLIKLIRAKNGITGNLAT